MAAHAKGIVHRDLKAGNVFLVEEGYGLKAVLIDFGLAKVRDPLLAGPVRSLPHIGVGTPSHMAPEQARGKPIDQRADIYAFGTMAYLMLAGRYPYFAEDITELLAMKLTSPPPDPRAFAPDLPDAWAECVLACLAINPDARPATMKEVATTLMNGVPNGPEVARELAPELLAVSESWEPTAKAPSESAVRANTAQPPELPTSTPMAAAGVSSQLSAASGRLRARLGLALGLMAVLSVVIAGVLLSRGGHPRGEEVAAGVAGASRPTRDAGDPSVVVVPSPDAGVVLAVTEPSDAAPTASAAGAEPDAGSVAPPVVTPRSPAGARGARDARIVQATGKGTAFITASPWAEVWIDGHSEGTTPVKVDLAAGAHRLKLEKPDGSVEESTFRVKPGEETRIKRSWENL
jgi:hypothetical protein